MSSSDDPDREIARELRLRAAPPTVARLSRRALLVLAGGGSAALALVVGGSLNVRRPPEEASKATSAPAPVGPPQQLVDLPKDYASLPRGTPRLGPPLPGDLGRPLLEGRKVAADAEPASPAAGSAASVTPARQQARAEAEQARASRLTVATTVRTPPAAALPPAQDARSRPAAPVGPKAAGNSGARERLLAGSVIRAALVTGVRSDLPGPVVAIVTQDVFDSVSGLSKLIPQGARLIGTYDSHVGFGQDRVQLAWSRLILPDGRSVALDQEKASDPQGYAGVEDRVDRHWRRLAGAALVSTMLGAGSEMGASASEGPVLQAFRMGAAQSANEAGQQVVGKSLDTQPTLIIRPGFEFRILVANDLTLEPWTQ